MLPIPSYIGAGVGKFSINPPLMPYAKGEWMVMADTHYVDSLERIHVIPKYFITDLASIPWIAEPIFDGVDSRLPGILHDWKYCQNQMDREGCDGLLRESLLSTGCDTMRSALIYSAVRVGGAGRYRQCSGGPKSEDFAWEYMSEYEVRLYRSAYKVIW